MAGPRRHGVHEQLSMIGCGERLEWPRHMLRYLRNLMVSFGVLGFVLQSLVGGVGAGRALCVGCEQGGWMVGRPCDPVVQVDCCAEEGATGQAPLTPGLPAAHVASDCECIDVPLPHRSTAVLTAARADAPNESVIHPDALIAWHGFELNAAPVRASWARAGPRAPSGLAPAQPRFTVLVI